MSGERIRDATRRLSGERSESAQADSNRAAESALLFFDYACVFCYVEHLRFKRLAAETGVAFTPVPFELRPDMPEEGISAAEHRLEHSERVESYLAKLAEQHGVALTVPDLIPKTHLAMVMGEVARDTGREAHACAHEALFAAYFGDRLDIGRPEVLLEVARATGLDPAEVERAWEQGTYEERLTAFKSLGHELGVTATPAALVCDVLLIGTQPYRAIAEAAARCIAPSSG